MTTARYEHGTLGWDFIWRIVLLAVTALILVLFAARSAGAIEPVGHVQPPRLVPWISEAWNVAVRDFRAGEFARAADGFRAVSLELQQRPEQPTAGPAVDAGLRLWHILAAQGDGDYHCAILGWNSALLSAETEAWRYLAIAAAYLDQGELDSAAYMLDRVWKIEPEHPLAHYYTGLMNLARADLAGEWPDAVGPSRVRWAVYRRAAVVPNTKGMYRLAATLDLEKAIQQADQLDTDMPLIGADWTVEAALRPTVADVMLALGADAFVANSHHTLGELFAERGKAEVAEEHLDAATRLGAHVLNAYADVAQLYETAGRHVDAARAYAKAIKGSPGRAAATAKMLTNIGRALRDLWIP